MARAAPPTPKGARQAEAILEAAITCLGRDGYAASSLQRIADEAGVGKRAVIYYFDNRENLVEQVVRRISDRLLTQVAEALEDVEEPADIVQIGFDRIWTQLTSDRALLAAYYGLVAEAVTNEDIKRHTRIFTDGYRTLLGGVAADMEARGRQLAIDPTVITEIIIAGIQGLNLTWLENGTTPALEQAIVEFQTWLSALAR
jgi:AcrR family transcriptional regulator